MNGARRGAILAVCVVFMMVLSACQAEPAYDFDLPTLIGTKGLHQPGRWVAKPLTAFSEAELALSGGSEGYSRQWIGLPYADVPSFEIMAIEFSSVNNAQRAYNTRIHDMEVLNAEVLDHDCDWAEECTLHCLYLGDQHCIYTARYANLIISVETSDNPNDVSDMAPHYAKVSDAYVAPKVQAVVQAGE